MNIVAPVGYNQKLKENEKRCIVCDKFFRRRGKRKFTARFCSFKCKGIWQKGKNLTGGRPHSGKKIKCLVCLKDFYVPKCYLLNRKYCSKKCWYKIIGRMNKGEKHYNWKGGIKHKNQKLRASAKYNNWRKKIFKRDNFTCQICKQKGGKLEADHILAWADYPKERFKIKNGRTLCKDCHKTTPNYKRNRK
ncbi:MAG: HNH endonuclease [Candidatus Pacebacteria bacterium]|nr:HNH endonuclease [Candidatus Paceibacterota bacterium]NUQ57519.1 HNH endonuclease [Candidatus Paceibacter sp.]